MKHFFRLTSLVIVLAAISTSAPQNKSNKDDGTRVVSGTVTDQNSKPIAQASVQIENEKTLQVRSYITEAHGEFHFAELSPDVDYDLNAVFDGIRSPKKTLSQFDSRRNPTVILVIKLPR